jgi:hypothetical protein
MSELIAKGLTDEQFKRVELFVTSCMDGVTLVRETKPSRRMKADGEFVLWTGNENFVYVRVGMAQVRAIGKLAERWDSFAKKELTTITTKSFSVYECDAIHDVSVHTIYPAQLSLAVLDLINHSKEMLKL